MFTGIVETTGRVADVRVDPDGRRLRVACPFAGSLDHGQSVAVAGVCLTVEDSDDETFAAFVASETLSKTTLGGLESGDAVNLERAVPADGRLGGHVVQGHVDGTTEVVSVEQVGEDWAYTFALPDDLERFVAPRGSVALDGVSLTVADVDDAAGAFRVAIIPTTHAETTIGDLEPGDSVNVEVDVLARYVDRLAA